MIKSCEKCTISGFREKLDQSCEKSALPGFRRTTATIRHLRRAKVTAAAAVSTAVAAVHSMQMEVRTVGVV